MILRTLVKHYENLVEKDMIASPGWTKQKISWALEIDDSGNLTQVHALSQEITKGKKTLLGPQEIAVPSPVKRTVGVTANFLADHSGYILGIDTKGNPSRTAECFQACRELHESILHNIDVPAAKAVISFFYKLGSFTSCQPPFPL